MVGPIPRGEMGFVLEAPAPVLTKIPPHELVGVTVLLLTCSYSGREFLRIGFYLHIVYNDEKYIEYRRSVEPPPEEELGDADDEEEEDPDAMEEDDADAEDGEDGDGDGDVDGEADAMDDDTEQQQQHQQQQQQPSIPHPTVPAQSEHKPDAVKIMSPQEFAGSNFDPSKLTRNILEAPRARTFDVDWNHPWNATLKRVYMMGSQNGKPQINREEWMQFFQTQALERKETLPYFEQEWAYQAWLEMLKRDPGAGPGQRTFDWLEDVELPKEVDILRIVELHKQSQKSVASSSSANPIFRK
eukprot:TRINITY_DN777_c0_g1_i1.p2 TRINITY_DN777_c0_g1~~TRINITY_DN777_c0_g1_i1.p2  ORF type:complete len:300 (-),score=88.29 TRINITY_DN777_c0_g1_i1:1537-2436(-)